MKTARCSSMSVWVGVLLLAGCSAVPTAPQHAAAGQPEIDASAGATPWQPTNDRGVVPASAVTAATSEAAPRAVAHSGHRARPAFEASLSAAGADDGAVVET